MDFTLAEKRQILLEFSDFNQMPSNQILLNGVDAVLSESEIDQTAFEFARSQSKWFSDEMVRSNNASSSQPLPFDIDVLSLRVYDGSYNACSLMWSKGKYVTLVNKGYLDLCKAVSYSASKAIFKICPDGSHPADDIAGHLKEYFANDGIAVAQPKFSTMDKSLFRAFSQAVDFFNQHMLMFILFHEYAHILFGHCDHFGEFEADIERRLRWEFLSDHFAAYLLSDGVLRRDPGLLFFAKPTMYLSFIVIHCIERHMKRRNVACITHPDVSSRVSTASSMMNFVYDVTLPRLGANEDIIKSLQKNEANLTREFSDSFGCEGEIIDELIKTG